MTPTPWGYDVKSLPPLATAADYEAITGKAATTAVEKALTAVSAAIRAYCGWHVSPSLECSASLDAEQGARCASLPCMGITDVTSVGDCASYEWSRSGLVRLKSGTFEGGWQSVSVAFVAGIDAPELVQLVCSIADGIAQAPTGISSESAGAVSVTWDADLSRVDSVLNDRTKSMLAPYRISRGE